MVNQRMITRRQLIQTAASTAGIIALPSLGWSTTQHGEGQLDVVSDGYLSLSNQGLVADQDESTLAEFLSSHNLDIEGAYTPPCNLTLWRHGDHTVLFDIGAGPNFMDSAGQLLDSLDALGVDPYDITHVAFTHAHPDHIWGLIDEFDELVCPNAEYIVSAEEFNYWMDPNTVDRMPPERQSFAVGAKRNLERIADGIRLAKFGEEVLPGVQAVDTRGHTPGHTAYEIRQGTESVYVVGDALVHSKISFERPLWQSSSDHDKTQAVNTRKALLPEIAGSKSKIVGYHLPSGIGHVDTLGDAYTFVADA